MSAFISPMLPTSGGNRKFSATTARRPFRFPWMEAEGLETSSTSVPEVCAGCGREGGIGSGCDGEGRIIGGLGAVVAWWPIKAYRPCPDFLKAKKTYRRAGQSLEEIAFGRKRTGDRQSISERLRGD